MKMKFVFGICSMLCVVVFLLVFLHSSHESDVNTLKLVHVLFRHGDRTPTQHEIYPTDPNALTNFYPIGYGQLTNVGKRRAYDLGKIIKKRYGDHLGELYTPDLIKAITTDADRTKMTIQLVLAALFPPSKTQKWNDDYNWMPIPYHYDKTQFDYTLKLPMAYCPKYLDELIKVTNEQGSVILDANRKLLNYTSNYAGKPMESLLDLFFLYHVLHHEEGMGLPLPSWTKPIYPEQLYDLAVHLLLVDSGSYLLTRLKAGKPPDIQGRFLSKIMENINRKVNNGDIDRKMYLYSVHENQIFSVLRALLDTSDLQFPKYCASIHIELHFIANEYFIKILYLPEPKGEFVALSVRKCSVLCPIGEFIKKIQPILPVNYTAECESKIHLD